MGRASLADKAEDVLRRHSKGAPLHYRRLTEVGIQEGLIVPTGSTPEASLNSAVTQDIKKRNASGDPQRFRSHGKGSTRSPGPQILWVMRSKPTTEKFVIACVWRWEKCTRKPLSTS